ncbi:MAG: hypothetical protein ABL928_16085 [Sphingorhabdus sp.]
MIPITVCGTDQPEFFMQAAIIVMISFAWGIIIGRLLRRRHWATSVVAAAVVSIALPCAAIYGIWPFDGKWRSDCGATPDPNIWVLYALLAWPIIVMGVSLLVRRLAFK